MMLLLTILLFKKIFQYKYGLRLLAFKIQGTIQNWKENGRE